MSASRSTSWTCRKLSRADDTERDLTWVATVVRWTCQGTASSFMSAPASYFARSSATWSDVNRRCTNRDGGLASAAGSLRIGAGAAASLVSRAKDFELPPGRTTPAPGRYRATAAGTVSGAACRGPRLYRAGHRFGLMYGLAVTPKQSGRLSRREPMVMRHPGERSG